MRVLSRSPDAETAGDLARLSGLSGSGDTENKGALVEHWGAVDERLAPLAYAAGLSAVEAQAREHAGTLIEADLRVLAVLRGYVLPD